jgi:mannose-6-phosphate isomerase
MNILRMVNPVMHYAWGSKSFIQTLLGDKDKVGQPQAELWLGAHPKASSQIQNGDKLDDLHYIIAEDPNDFLGSRTARTYHDQLPFLLKVLAAEQPLSIQVHPNHKQAREGFARENKLSIQFDAANRNYKDTHPKPELLVALTEFQALCGFRSLYELGWLVGRLLPQDQLPEIKAFTANPHQENLEALYTALLNVKKLEKKRLISNYLNNLRAFKAVTKQEKLMKRWTAVLEQLYPDDIGLLSPLLMNIIILQPMQGLYIDSGVLHAYLHGAGMEIMANSDNVLRGGLTPKHVDIAELAKVVDISPGFILPIKAEKISITERIYPVPPEEFALSYIRHTRDRKTICSPSGSPEILFCYEGSFVVENCSQFLTLEKGQSLFVPYEVEGYAIKGKGTIFRAKVNI